MTHHYPVPWGKLGWSGTTNQGHYPDLGSDASSVGNFLHSFLGHHLVGKPVVAMKMLAVLSGYANSCAFSLSLFTSLLACLMIQLGRHVPYSVASFQIQVYILRNNLIRPRPSRLVSCFLHGASCHLMSLSVRSFAVTSILAPSLPPWGLLSRPRVLSLVQ